MIKQTDPNTKTIRFSPASEKKLRAMALKSGMTKLDFFTAMVDYFHKSGKDPRDASDELLKKELIRRTDRIIAFIRTTEDELLRPLISSNAKVAGVQGKLLSLFEREVVSQNRSVQSQLRQHSETLSSIGRSARSLEEAQRDRAWLKRQFSRILEDYIASRDTLGMISGRGEKEQLAQRAKRELESL